MNLRQITIKDQLELKKVYFDSIQSLDEKIYSQVQKRAWSSQAWNNPNFDKSIIKGKGWLISKQGIIIAFATRYPTDRIALFYCCLLYTSPSPRDGLLSRMPSSA